jgi:hypothetical protein
VDEVTPFSQKTFNFDQSKNCAEPSKAVEGAPLNNGSGREEAEKLVKVSRNNIPNNPTQVELKNLLADLCVLKNSSTSDILSNKDQDYDLIPRIINLNPSLTQQYIAQEIFGTICEGLGVTADIAKTQIEHIKNSKPGFHPLDNRTVFEILTRRNGDIKPLQCRPTQEEKFNQNFFKKLNFNNPYHALNWVINAEDKLKFFINKAKKNMMSKTDFYRYLVLLRRGLEMINIQNQQAQVSFSDGKTESVGGERYWE